MTQNQMLLEHFQTIGSITAAEAMTKYGIGRLAARVSDLRRNGYNVQTETVRARNRFGKTISFTRYWVD